MEQPILAVGLPEPSSSWDLTQTLCILKTCQVEKFGRSERGTKRAVKLLLKKTLHETPPKKTLFGRFWCRGGFPPALSCHRASLGRSPPASPGGGSGMWLIRADSMHNSLGFGEGGRDGKGQEPSLCVADSIPSPGAALIGRRPSLRVRDAHAAPREGTRPPSSPCSSPRPERSDLSILISLDFFFIFLMDTLATWGLEGCPRTSPGWESPEMGTI